MSSKPPPTGKSPRKARGCRDEVVAQAQRDRAERERGYRSQALKMYPWVCGKCAREFTVANVQELTVHHRDHNHDNNPGDGSNWELLCVYCHDNEHARYLDGGASMDDTRGPVATYQPFASLGSLLKKPE